MCKNNDTVAEVLTCIFINLSYYYQYIHIVHDV